MTTRLETRTPPTPLPPLPTFGFEKLTSIGTAGLPGRSGRLTVPLIVYEAPASEGFDEEPEGVVVVDGAFAPGVVFEPAEGLSAGAGSSIGGLESTLGVRIGADGDSELAPAAPANLLT